jgi:hypothetical protein
MAPYLATQQAKGLPSKSTTSWNAYQRCGCYPLTLTLRMVSFEADQAA